MNLCQKVTGSFETNIGTLIDIYIAMNKVYLYQSVAINIVQYPHTLKDNNNFQWRPVSGLPIFNLKWYFFIVINKTSTVTDV